jgi:hypothetical protein
MDSSCDDSRRIDAIRAGKKRSITERLGNRRTDQMDSGHLDLDDGQNQIDNMSIPQPGVSRNIPGMKNYFSSESYVFLSLISVEFCIW